MILYSRRYPPPSRLMCINMELDIRFVILEQRMDDCKVDIVLTGIRAGSYMSFGLCVQLHSSNVFVRAGNTHLVAKTIRGRWSGAGARAILRNSKVDVQVFTQYFQHLVFCSQTSVGVPQGRLVAFGRIPETEGHYETRASTKRGMIAI